MLIFIKINEDDTNLNSLINNLKNNLICFTKFKSKNITNENNILSVIVTKNNLVYPKHLFFIKEEFNI